MLIPRWFVAVCCLALLGMLVVIWGLTLFVYGTRQEVNGYTLGCEATKARIPAAGYIEAGRSFCYDQGNYYEVRRSAVGFKVLQARQLTPKK